MNVNHAGTRFRTLFLLCIVVALCIMLFTMSTNIFQSSPTILQTVPLFDSPSKSESKNEVKNFSEKNCKPKQNILFLKTHKTGSSSVQNILFRYGDEHNLTFVLPKIGNYFGHPEPFNRRMLNLSQTLVEHTNASISMQKNIFTCHTRYNYKEMKFIMPADTIFVTILRDPLTLVESLFSFYDFKQITNQNSTVQSLEMFFSNSSNRSAYHASFINRTYDGRYGRNQMCFDLGFDVEHFDNLEMIRKFVETIDSQFHLVMIADRMEESLIHLQHLLCWTLNDMIVFRHNARNADISRNLSIALKQNIRLFNIADELLYKHFDAKLTRQTNAFGKREMEKQIISLRHATNLMYNKCVEKEVQLHPLVPSFKQRNSTEEKCQRLTIHESVYMDLLLRKQELRNGAFGVHAKRAKMKI